MHNGCTINQNKTETAMWLNFNTYIHNTVLLQSVLYFDVKIKNLRDINISVVILQL